MVMTGLLIMSHARKVRHQYVGCSCYAYNISFGDYAKREIIFGFSDHYTSNIVLVTIAPSNRNIDQSRDGINGRGADFCQSCC